MSILAMSLSAAHPVLNTSSQISDTQVFIHLALKGTSSLPPAYDSSSTCWVLLILKNEGYESNMTVSFPILFDTLTQDEGK